MELPKDQEFAELGKCLCEARDHGYWRLGYKSFEHFLESKFPDSRRKAHYSISLHDHLLQIPTKALEVAKVARSKRQRI